MSESRRPSKIAALAAGYADGLARQAEQETEIEHIPHFRSRLMGTVNPLPIALQDAQDRSALARRRLEAMAQREKALQQRMKRLPGLGI